MIKNLKRKIKKSNLNIDIKVVNKRTKFWKPFILLLPSIVLVTMFVILPFIAASMDAFQVNIDPNRPLLNEVGIDNFTTIFLDPDFHNSLFNSFLYALISIPITIAISAIIASAISHVIRKWLRGFWQTIFFLPYVTSAAAIGLAFAYFFDADQGLFNLIFGTNVQWLEDSEGNSALWAMLIYGVWRTLAFNILIFTTAMLGVDKKLYKSASIDGASKMKQFFKITLPSIRKTTNFLITMGIIGAIKVFPLALFKNNSSAALANNGGSLLMYIYHSVSQSNFQIAGAASLILFVISVGFTFFIRGGMSLITKTFEKWGEKRVENKIKSTHKIIRKKN